MHWPTKDEQCLGLAKTARKIEKIRIRKIITCKKRKD